MCIRDRPQFVTLLLVRNFFSNNGIFNTMMANAGVTDFLHNIGPVSYTHLAARYGVNERKIQNV